MSPSASGRISAPGSVAATSIDCVVHGGRALTSSDQQVDQVAVEDAIEIANHRTAHLGVVVVIRR